MNNALSKIQCPEFVLFYDREASRTYILTYVVRTSPSAVCSVRFLSFGSLQMWYIVCIWEKKGRWPKKETLGGKDQCCCLQQKLLRLIGPLAMSWPPNGSHRHAPRRRFCPMCTAIRHWLPMLHKGGGSYGRYGWDELFPHENFLWLPLFTFLKVIKYWYIQEIV